MIFDVPPAAPDVSFDLERLSIWTKYFLVCWEELFA